MASGLPVVGADAPGTASLVLDQSTGYLCPPADEHAFSVALEKLIVDESLRGGMSQAAIEEAHRYDWDKVLAKMVTYYNEVLGTGAPSKSAPFVRPQSIRRRPMVTG